MEIEVFIAMNEAGEHSVATDEFDAAAELAENAGGICVRVVKIKVKMAPPVITEAEVAVHDDPSAEVEATVASKQACFQ